MTEPSEEDMEMREEYDFSGGKRGKHYRAYRAGHRVCISKANGTAEEHRFTLEDGAVMLDPDLRTRYPDSDAVNRALRSLTTQH